MCDLEEGTLECVHHRDAAVCPADVEEKGNNSRKNYYKLGELGDKIKCM